MNGVYFIAVNPRTKSYSVALTEMLAVDNLKRSMSSTPKKLVIYRVIGQEELPTVDDDGMIRTKPNALQEVYAVYNRADDNQYQLRG